MAEAEPAKRSTVHTGRVRQFAQWVVNSRAYTVCVAALILLSVASMCVEFDGQPQMLTDALGMMSVVLVFIVVRVRIAICVGSVVYVLNDVGFRVPNWTTHTHRHVESWASCATVV